MNLQGIVGSGLRTSPHHTAQARRNPYAVHLRRYFYPDQLVGVPCDIQQVLPKSRGGICECLF